MSKTKWFVLITEALYFVITIALFASIGVMLAWRG